MVDLTGSKPRRLCRNCGKNFIVGSFFDKCRQNPTEKHIAVADGQNCVYCGRKFNTMLSCSNSPTKKHRLDL